MTNARIFVLISLATLAFAGSKERVWQEGKLLDRDLNGYFVPTDFTETAAAIQDAANPDTRVNTALVVTVFDNYVLEAAGTVYLVEVSRLKNAKAARLSLVQPVKLSVEKKNLRFIDLEGREVQGHIVKQAEKNPQVRTAAR
jgi:hypothetical protein